MFTKNNNKILSALIAGLMIITFMAAVPNSAVQAATPEAYGPPADNSGTCTDCDSSNSDDCQPVKTRNGSGIAMGSGNNGNGSGQALSPLSEAEAAGLIEAIEEEFGAMSLYQHVMNTFGDVVPFNSIAGSEEQHLNTLLRQADKYGIAVPQLIAAELPAFSSLSEACQAGAAAEIADAALYDTLLADVTHSDLVRVYTNLQSASLDNHLPEFESCQ